MEATAVSYNLPFRTITANTASWSRDLRTISDDDSSDALIPFGLGVPASPLEMVLMFPEDLPTSVSLNGFVDQTTLFTANWAY